MTLVQPEGEGGFAPDIEFRSERRKVLYASLALGIFAFMVVRIHSAFVADPVALTDERYVWDACRLGNPLPIPEPVCPRLLAGEPPFTVLYALIIAPLLVVRGRARTMLTIAILSLTFALLQGVFADYPILPASPFPPYLNPHLLPSPFERAPATCGLVMCGLDHTLFHFAQMPFILVLAFFGYRAYRAVRVEGEHDVSHRDDNREISDDSKIAPSGERNEASRGPWNHGDGLNRSRRGAPTALQSQERAGGS